MDFNNIVRCKRKERSLSLFEMSQLTNISEKTLSKIEEGSALPTLEGLMEICKALDVTPNDILLNASFDYQKSFSTHRPWRKDTKIVNNDITFTRNFDNKQIKLLKNKNGKLYTALVQRKLGVGYCDAKKFLEKNANKE